MKAVTFSASFFSALSALAFFFFLWGGSAFAAESTREGALAGGRDKGLVEVTPIPRLDDSRKTGSGSRKTAKRLLSGAASLSDVDDNDLVILGVHPSSRIDRFPCPDDSWFVRIAVTGSDSEQKTDPASDSTASRRPSLKEENKEENKEESQADATSPSLSSEPEFFVCRINHLSPREKSLLTGAKDGLWNDLDFLNAVLVAEGIPESRISLVREIYLSLLTELKKETEKATDDLEKTRIVFEFLHRRVLTGSYSLNRSSVAVSLETGVFNCVSASVLFNALARGVGLESYGLETTGHAKSRIIFDDSFLDVETTCPNWDLLPDKPVLFSESVAVARPVSPSTKTSAPSPNGDSVAVSLTPVSSSSTEAKEVAGDVSENPVTQAEAMAGLGKRPVRAVTPIEFVATVYYNRGVDYYQRRQFGPAIASYLKAASLDPNNETVLGNLKATLNNLAIELAASRQNFAEAIRLTEQGLLLDPSFNQFKTNLPLYYRHWIEELRNNHQFNQAGAVEARFRKRFPDSQP